MNFNSLQRLVVHEHIQAVLAGRELGLAEPGGQRRHGRSVGLARSEPVAAVAVQQVLGGRRCLGRLRRGSHQSQQGYGRGLDVVAEPRLRGRATPVGQLPAFDHWRLGLGLQHVQHFLGDFRAVQVGQGQRRVGQRGRTERVAFAVQAINVGKVGRLGGRQRVQHDRLAIVVVGRQLGHHALEVHAGLVVRVIMNRHALLPGTRQCPEAHRGSGPIGVLRASPTPPAVFLLSGYERPGKALSAVHQASIGGLGCPDCFGILDGTGHGQQIGPRHRGPARRRHEHVAAGRPMWERAAAQRHLDHMPLEGRCNADGHPATFVLQTLRQFDDYLRIAAGGAAGVAGVLQAPRADR